MQEAVMHLDTLLEAEEVVTGMLPEETAPQASVLSATMYSKHNKGEAP